MGRIREPEVLIATAGHIDHGKTSLVRALTGVETDRLPEEKARGISIDLGFAYWRVDGGTTIGFVDVPGHERYVRNMLAGVGGVDFAMIVIAADDGVMPQTIEHVRILDLLGIARGVAVLTKCDKVSAARADEVEQAASELLAGTGLAGATVFRVSAITGEGIDVLAATLRAAALNGNAEPAGAFRLAIGKCFTVPGAGTVASGTILSGAVAVGDHLVLSPQGRDLRVRGIQSAGRGVDRARAGERAALNLAGVEVDEVHRGDWLVAAGHHAPTSRIEALIRLAPEREAPLRHDSRVHLHIGTADIPARVLLRRQPAGAGMAATLLLDQPTLARNGERFVLRDQSGRELLGGGRVLDPHPPLRKPRGGEREAVLAVLAMFAAEEVLTLLVAIPGHETDRVWFERCFNLTEDEARALYVACGVEVAGAEQAILADQTALEEGRKAIVGAVSAFHADHPEAGGVTQRDLRGRLNPPPSAVLLAWQVRRLIDEGQLVQSGALLRQPQHSPSFGAAENALWRDLLATYGDAKPQQIGLAEAASALRSTEGAVRTMLYRRRQNGDLWALDEGRFMLREHVAILAACAAQLAEKNPEGFSAAQFRDASGIGRNLVIRVLEFFDRIGITGRRGDVRIVRPDWRSLVGD